MFDPSTDPLGIGVQQRAAAQRWQNIFQGLNPVVGPLPDPQWEGYDQAVQEAAGGKPVNYTGGASPAGSSQITGQNTNGAVGTETYGSSKRGMNSTFETPGMDSSFTTPSGVSMPQVTMPTVSMPQVTMPGVSMPGSTPTQTQNGNNAAQTVQGVPSSLLALNPDPSFWNTTDPSTIRSQYVTGAQNRQFQSGQGY